MLTVGELAKRIWTLAGNEGEPEMDLIGIRPGETMSEVLIGPGEEVGEERYQGIARSSARSRSRPRPGCSSGSRPAAAREDARAVWMEAMRRPGLIAPRVRSAQQE